MTETDAAAKPVDLPVTFLPYLEKYRLYKLFKEMMQDLVLHLPKDPLLHMKNFLKNREIADPAKLILLVSPELQLDIPSVVRAMIKDFGAFVITRRTVLDHYEKHDDFKPGCVDPPLMAEVTKNITLKDEVVQNGWLMYDHPCTLREARCLQQDGVIPTVTLCLTPTPLVAPPAQDPRTKERHFFQQDFEGLKYAYEASLKIVEAADASSSSDHDTVTMCHTANTLLKEVYIDSTDCTEVVSSKCFNAVRACAAGAQGAFHGLHSLGAPGVYRVALVGPRGTGRKTQAALLAKQFNMVYLNFSSLLATASARDDDMGRFLRQHGPSVEMKARIVRQRLLEKDCIHFGYVIIGFPMSGAEFELFEHMETPPNRIVFMNTDMESCKQRILSRGTDWCTGKIGPLGAPRTRRHPRDDEKVVEAELDAYFSDGIAEMRAAAGLAAWEIDANKPMDQVQTNIQAAVIAAPCYDLKCYSTGLLENARAD